MDTIADILGQDASYNQVNIIYIFSVWIQIISHVSKPILKLCMKKKNMLKTIYSDDIK